MTLAPHPIEIRTVLMCALLQAGHDVPTAQRMMEEAFAAIHFEQEAPVHGPESTSRYIQVPSAPPAPAENDAVSHPIRGETASNPPPHASTEARLAKLDTTSMTIADMASALNVTSAYVYLLCKKHGLEYRRAGRGPDRKPRAKRLAEAAARAEPKRRFTEHAALDPETVQPLADDHPAVVEGRTLFPSTVVDPKDSPRLLVSGEHNRKIGGSVVKGPWTGMPIFVLTLEERATCPRSCHVWSSCYGNGMPQARRHRHGLGLEIRLERELAEAETLYPQGFVVRLHQLGDFYSLAYVNLWMDWLLRFPGLRVFGYTAHSRRTEIGRAIDSMTALYWDRFAVRFSSATPGRQGATTIWRQPEGPTVAEGIVCPAQTDATACCGTCGLCWSAAAREKTIVFVGHGRRFRSTPHNPKINAKARERWPGELRIAPPPETGDPVPEGRRRLPTKTRRRCDCGQMFETDILDQTTCATCTQAAQRSRLAQAGAGQ